MKKIIDRWKSESPTIFKNLTNILTGMSAISVAILTIPSAPVALTTIAGYLAVGGTIGSILSKLTKKDITNEDTSNKKD